MAEKLTREEKRIAEIISKKASDIEANEKFRDNYVYTREILFEKTMTTEQVRQRPIVFHPVPIGAEPKRDNRFVVILPDEFEIESWLVQSCDLPKIRNGELQPIKITFLDLIGPSTSTKVLALFEICADRKRREVELFDFTIALLDPIGIRIEEWTISVSELLEVDFGVMDYGDNSLHKLSILVQPNNCIIQ